MPTLKQLLVIEQLQKVNCTVDAESLWLSLRESCKISRATVIIIESTGGKRPRRKIKDRFRPVLQVQADFRVTDQS